MNYEDAALNNFMAKLVDKLNEMKNEFNKLSPYNQDRARIAAQQEIVAILLNTLISS